MPSGPHSSLPVGEFGASGFVIEIRVGGIRAVVSHARERAGFVRAMAHGEPFIADPQVLAHAEFQAFAQRGLPEHAHHILVRTHVYGIPARVLRIPKIEIIVMHAHADEIFRAGLLVETHQMIGIELVAFPGGNDVFESELLGWP